MLSPIRIAAMVLMCVLGTVPASATPVTYDEAVSGDLGDAFPATLFVLDLGINTVAGTIAVQPFIAPSPADFDNFAISVPAGMHLTDLSYSFVAAINPGTIQAVIQYDLNNGNASYTFPPLASVNIDQLGTGLIHPFGAALPLGAGTYAVQQVGLGAGGTGTPGFRTDYTWHFTVEQDTAVVPEPTTFCLLGTGLLVARARRWRGTRQAPHRTARKRA
jgi:PEP-CTERM motif-containing protein